MKNNEPFDLEAVYDTEIAPLMTQIIEICKKHGMPMLASFCYAKGKEPGYPDGVSHCTTCIPRILDGGETGWNSPELKAAFRAVMTNQRGGFAAFAITSK